MTFHTKCLIFVAGSLTPQFFQSHESWVVAYDSCGKCPPSCLEEKADSPLEASHAHSAHLVLWITHTGSSEGS